MAPKKKGVDTGPAPSELFFNRELSWLAFARRVLALAENPELPLTERMKFAGIMGMLHDEFFMKRMSGLKRQMRRRSNKLSLDGRRPAEEFAACREVLLEQVRVLGDLVSSRLRPALAEQGIPIRDWEGLSKRQKKALRTYFHDSVAPILTPLAVDAEHPFPFISNLGLNLAVLLREGKGGRERFVRVKVPDNRPRWVPLPDGAGFVPLEQVIAANLDLMFSSKPRGVWLFRLTRGAEGEPERMNGLIDDEPSREPGSIIRQVSNELKARRFAGVVRLQVDPSIPGKTLKWLSRQLVVDASDVYPADFWLGMRDLMQFRPDVPAELCAPVLEPVTHPRLRELDPDDTSAIFRKIDRGDILLHHPYHSFDNSVLRFLESAAFDPDVLAIKLTIYRTSSDSPIVRALAEAARRGKQVAVLVEITARFDEAPNIAWGQYLEREGVHVAYGVESLKTHVKLALVVRESEGRIKRYCHVGTGNYHTGTARIYEDLGLLTSEPDICADVTAVFNELTGAITYDSYRKVLVAPRFMRERFNELIRREAEHAKAGRPSGIHAKMNQLQDPEIIRELYRASQAGVPIVLNIRGLCCLRPGVPELSETIRVFSVVGRFLEHSRVYRFENGGSPEYFLGSADWMKRNLANRMETIAPVLDPRVQAELAEIFEVYEVDNASAWDCGPDGRYVCRAPPEGGERRVAQEIFIDRARRLELEATGRTGQTPATLVPRSGSPARSSQAPAERPRRRGASHPPAETRASSS